MIRSLRSEIIRFRRTALAAAAAAVMSVLAVAVTSFLFLGSTPAGPGEGGFGPGGQQAADLTAADGSVAGLVSVATLLGIVALSTFAVSVARDYDLGTIRLLLVAEPQRRRLLAGKLDRFYRSAGQRSSHGHGIGLAIVRAVVEAHDGSVEISDVPAGGARVTMWFPDAPAADTIV